MKKLILLAFSALFSFVTNAYTWLSVSDPRTSWNTEQGTISDATFSIRPSGAFSEVSVYLTFSAQNTSWATKTDSLEIVLDFDLPKNAQVTDSWLWMGDEIVKALMLDRSQATQIYENIVKRRRDPSIVYKNSPTQYQLRVFPMLGNASRKVKLTFLIASQLESGVAITNIPLNIVQASRTLPPSLACIAHTNQTWSSPSLKQFPLIQFNSVSDSQPLKGKKAVITSLAGLSFLGMEYSHTVNTNKYFTTYTQNGETYYQIMIDHMQAFGLAKPAKKTVFVLDYESPAETETVKYPYTHSGYNYNSSNWSSNTIYDDTSTFSKRNLHNFYDVKQALKNILHDKFTDDDQFNIAFSKNTIAEKKSESWILSNFANINTYIDGLDSTMAGKSSLVHSLPEAYQFLKAQGGGSIFIISNRHIYENITATGGLLEKLKTINFKADRIDLFDFSNVAKASLPTNNDWNYYYGNGVIISTTYNNKLYQLASHTKYFNQILGGCYSYYYKNRYSNGNSYWEKCHTNNNLTSTAVVFDDYFEKLTNFDYTAFINSGYNSGEYLLGMAGSTTLYPYGKLSLIGKYKGTMPLHLRLSASYKGVKKYATLSFNSSDTIAASGLLRQFWAGHEISALEQTCDVSNNYYYDYYYSNCSPDVETRLQIARVSLDNRVLSRYTAFFAPEIGFLEVEACTTCVDESVDNFPSTALSSAFGQPSFFNSGQAITSILDADSVFNSLAVVIFPNPAIEKATIRLNKLDQIAASLIKIEIYNTQGSLLLTLDNPEIVGNKLEYEWKLTDQYGNRVAKGIYIIAINMKGVKRFKKLMVE